MRPGLKPVDEPVNTRADVETAGWLGVVLRHRLLLLLAAVGGGAVALIVSTLMSPVFEATSTLRLVESKLMQEQRANALPSLGGVRALVQTGSIAAAAMRKFDLGSAEGLTRTGFLQRITADQVPGSSLVRVRVRMSDGNRAAEVANWLANEVIGINRDLNQKEALEARDFIGKQREEALTKLQATQSRLLEFKQAAQLDLTKKDVEAALKVREDLLALRIEVEAGRASLARTETDLAKTEPFITMRRSFDPDNVFVEAARGTAGGDRGLLGMQMLDQTINPVHRVLGEEAAKSRTKLRGLEEQLNQATKIYGVSAPSNPRLQQMYRDEIRLKSLEAEHDLLLKIYSDLASRYEIARIQVASQSAELQLVDPALPPERPIAPRRSLNVVVGSGFGLVFGLIWILLRDAARMPRSGASERLAR